MKDAKDRGRSAHARRAWADAYDALSLASADGPLDADDVERLAWSALLSVSEKEKSALAYAEALTNVQAAGAPDSVYLPLKAHFEDRAIVDLTLAIALINAFTRVSIGMGA